jgi:uncharacterized protein (DUF4415 family)
MMRRGEDKTDVDALRAMTDEHVEASIDLEDEGSPNWSTLSAALPGASESITIFYDSEVLEWFRAKGAGYKTLMNDVLRSYVEEQSKKTA